MALRSELGLRLDPKLLHAHWYSYIIPLQTHAMIYLFIPDVDGYVNFFNPVWVATNSVVLNMLSCCIGWTRCFSLAVYPGPELLGSGESHVHLWQTLSLSSQGGDTQPHALEASIQRHLAPTSPSRPFYWERSSFNLYFFWWLLKAVTFLSDYWPWGSPLP